jgi:hypothetical protein
MEEARKTKLHDRSTQKFDARLHTDGLSIQPSGEPELTSVLAIVGKSSSIVRWFKRLECSELWKLGFLDRVLGTVRLERHASR